MSDCATYLLFVVSKNTEQYTENSGILGYRIMKDCCSESWIENITMPKDPEFWIDNKVLSIEDKRLPSQTKKSGNVTKFYSCEIKTSLGSIEIEYRNESNGYYGAEIELIDQLPDEIKFKILTGDYPSKKSK